MFPAGTGGYSNAFAPQVSGSPIPPAASFFDNNDVMEDYVQSLVEEKAALVQELSRKDCIIQKLLKDNKALKAALAVKQSVDAVIGATQPATSASFGSLQGASSGSQQVPDQMPFSEGSKGSYMGNVTTDTAHHAPIMSTELGQQTASTGIDRSGRGGLVAATPVNCQNEPSAYPPPLAVQPGSPTTMQQASIPNVTMPVITSSLPQGSFLQKQILFVY